MRDEDLEKLVRTAPARLGRVPDSKFSETRRGQDLLHIGNTLWLRGASRKSEGSYPRFRWALPVLGEPGHSRKLLEPELECQPRSCRGLAEANPELSRCSALYIGM